jgi:hypothetical protein
MSGGDTTRFAIGSMSCVLNGFLFFRGIVGFAYGLIWLVFIGALTYLVAGRKEPRNWNRVSKWFFWLGLLLPTSVFGWSFFLR